ncbi:MAG: hypothetical protein ACNS63_11710 [Candidatus Nitrospinota bacterium M3_3B_026]
MLVKTISAISKSSMAFLALLGALAVGGALSPTWAEAGSREYPYVFFDQKSKDLVGEKVAGKLIDFFHKAEQSIRDKDIDALMSLYSESYANGPHTKESIERVWRSVFERFDRLYTKHNMRFLTSSNESPAVIIRCSGILMGTPKGESDAYSIALDHWINNDHVLARENGAWRLIGTAGKEMKRFGFDKPIHPLF